MDLEQYASVHPVSSDHLLELVGEYQRNADAEASEESDAKKLANQHKAKKEAWIGKIATIGRAQEKGIPLYQLKGGELTTEKPDTDGHLPFEGDEPAEEAVDVEEDVPASSGVEVEL